MNQVVNSSDWMALESNPEVINEYGEKLGINTSKYTFADLYDTDEEVLKAMSERTLSALLIFPLDEKNSAATKEQADKIEKDGQVISKDLYFMKQYAQNACGSIAIIHAALNALGENADVLKGDSILSNFLETTRNMTPEERAEQLVVQKQLQEQHIQAVNQGETELEKDREDDPDVIPHHFVCLVPKENSLYELDGCKNFPINHGPTTSKTLLLDIMRVFREFTANSSNEYSFSMILFQKNEEEEEEEEDQAGQGE